MQEQKKVIRVFGGGESSWQIGPFTMALQSFLGEYNTGQPELEYQIMFCSDMKYFSNLSLYLIMNWRDENIYEREALTALTPPQKNGFLVLGAK